MAKITVDFSRTNEWRERYMRMVAAAETRGVPRRYAIVALDIEAVTDEPRNLRSAGRRPLPLDHPGRQKRIDRIHRELVATLQECAGRGFAKRLAERVEDAGIVSGRRVADWISVYHSDDWS